MTDSNPNLGKPLAILCELTHRCPLQCPYCSNPLELEKAATELSTEKWIDVLEQAAKLGVFQAHFSGGEPGLRPDLERLVEKASEFGIYTNLITSAVTFDKPRIEALTKLGLEHVQISIQDYEEKNANFIGGNKQGYAKKMEVAKAVVGAGLPLTVNAPIHRMNIEHLPQIIDLAVEMEGSRMEIAHVQYYGWAYHNRSTLMPTITQLEKANAVVAEAIERLKGIMVIDFVVPDYYAKRPKACMSGWGRQFLNVTPSGKVLPCHAAESIDTLRFDNVLEHSLEEIWEHSEAFEQFRGTSWMPAKCRSCERHTIDWGGCRCQAFAITGDAANMDPACEFSDHHEAMLSIAQTASHKTDSRFDYRRIGFFNREKTGALRAVSDAENRKNPN